MTVWFCSEFLRSQLRYDPRTGAFFWKVSRPGVMAGTRAGGLTPHGRRVIKLNRRPYFDSVLAWLYMTGHWPEGQIDHKDTDPLNCRWDNLREATRSQNSANKKPRGASGVKHVFLDKGKKYKVVMTIAGEYTYHGTYPTLEEAAEVAKAKAIEIYGEFARVDGV